jgi:hypothetical protein
MLVSQAHYADEAALVPAVESAKDHRWARRHNCRIAAEILHDTLPEAVICVVRDTSSSGARIELTTTRGAFAASAERIPDHFTLVMPMDRMAVECRVSWRRGAMLGVRYLTPARSVPKRPSPRFAPQKKAEGGLLGKLFKK